MAFYLYLPSNSSTNFFVDNTITHFRTKLARRFNLDVKYEVAIVEFSYFPCLKLFTDNENDRIILISYKDEISGEVQRENILIPNKPFASIQELVLYINHRIGNYTATISIWYDKALDRIKVNSTKGTFIQISKTLATLLGLDKTGYFGNGESEGNSDVHSNRGHYLYIYSDIVSNQIVGDTSSPLLRIVNNTLQSNKLTTVNFRPYYKEVVRNEFDTIEIQVCNEFGETVQFVKGPTTVVLHFRPIILNANQS